MFSQAGLWLLRTTDIEPTRAFTLEYVDGRHQGYGGPGRVRTDDLFHAINPERQVLTNSNIVISGRAPRRIGKPVVPMPRLT